VLCVRIARRARTHPCVIVYFMSLFYFQLENVMVWLINHLEMFSAAHVRSHSHTQFWGFIFIFFQVPSTSYILSADRHKPIIKTKCYRARRCKSEELLYLIADYKHIFIRCPFYYYRFSNGKSVLAIFYVEKIKWSDRIMLIHPEVWRRADVSGFCPVCCAECSLWSGHLLWVVRDRLLSLISFNFNESI
jgi:hypothetical protein